ncbi:MAG: hypothetical protein ABII12_17805 [Planctomycetota bacterium]
MNDSHSYGTRSLRELVRIMFQHWFMMLFIVVVGTGGTYYVCLNVAPTFRSKVSLMFKRPLNRSPISTDQGERALEVFVKAQQQIVQSDFVMARTKVIAEDPALRGTWGKLREKWEKARAQSGGDVTAVQSEIGAFLQDQPEKAGTVAHGVAALLEKNQREFKKFVDSVKLETPGGEQVAMTETFTLIVDRPGIEGAPDSYKNAMYAADTLADMYVVRYMELQQELNDPALQVTEDVLLDYSRDVDDTLDKYERFVRAHSADIGVLEQLLKSGTEHGTQVVLTEIRKNDAQLALDLARDMAIRDAIKQTLPPAVLEPGGLEKMSPEEVAAAVESVPVEFLKDNAGYGELLKALATLEGKYAKTAAQYTEASRDIQYLEEQLSRSKRYLLRAVVAHFRGLEAGILARQQQKSENVKLVKETAAEQNSIHCNLAEYARLKNDFQVALKHIERLQQERIDAMTNRLRARESVTIAKMDAASVPDKDRPVSPKTLIYTAAALIVSILLGAALAFLAEHFDHSLRSIGEAERYLGVPVLGSVKKRGRGLVVST